MEIIEINGEYRIEHDGEKYTPEAIIEHIRENGHPRESVSYFANPENWQDFRGIAQRIDSVFDAKDKIRRKRQRI